MSAQEPEVNEPTDDPKDLDAEVVDTPEAEAGNESTEATTEPEQDELSKLREERDQQLSAPKLILPSIQVNIRAGHMPPPEDNGTVYLKLPVNIFGEPKTLPDDAGPRTQ